ncbi:MAG: hypothetical protein N2439_06270, partial [Anaerolineae bacterium]|nr:hypothetical protein [Anaerolineae bacterium]
MSMEQTRGLLRAVHPWVRALLAMGLAAFAVARVHAVGEVRLPNMEWVESHVDLSVKVLGGQVTIRRTWSRGRWYINPAWARLRFERDPLDNSVLAIDRGGSLFERAGGLTVTDGTGSSGSGPAPDAVGTAYVFDRQYVIRRTAEGWRWSDRRGNTVDYAPDGRIVAYADRNQVRVQFVYAGERLDRIVDHNGQTALTFTYTGDSLTEIADRTGRRVRYAYAEQNGRRLLTTVTDPTGAQMGYTYNADGQITRVTDAEGRSWQIVYSSSVPAPPADASSGIELKSTLAGRTTSGVGTVSGAVRADIPAIAPVLGAASGGGAVLLSAPPTGGDMAKANPALRTDPITVGA